MSIRPEFFDYLAHFGPTVPLCEFAASPGRPAVALRHDVDHDLDLALELACREAQRSARASYFLLHTAEYWRDERLAEKCLQLQDFGHEVGLHFNGLALWQAGAVDDLAAATAALLAPLRRAGVRITGVSSHGDKACYAQGFINYWAFAELRPADPAATEHGLSAEGVPTADERFRVPYPPEHCLRRPDGAICPLWSVSMAALGLAYDAVHVPCDGYFTDSGGSWSRSADPRTARLAGGRHQVLMHPEHWRGPRRTYVFLSTARSGSKWLATVLERASSVTARHELALNHRYEEGRLRPDKHTGERLAELAANRELALDLLWDAREYREGLVGDYAEVNVYLEQFLPELRSVWPEATLIHLHRRGQDVVRSVINRDWYDTPEDRRHPSVGVEGFAALGQFEKACWYWRDTNERLAALRLPRLVFERMTADGDYLRRVLGEWGVAFYPRLAEKAFAEAVNANTNDEFPPYSRWPRRYRDRFHAITDSVSATLGYGATAARWPRLRALWRAVGGIFRRSAAGAAQAAPPRTLADWNFAEPTDAAVFGCRAEGEADGLAVTADGDRHAYVLLGGGEWNRLTAPAGWEVAPATYYRGALQGRLGPQASAQLMCLMYDAAGALRAKRSLGRLRPDGDALEFAFKPRAATARFNLAVHMPQACPPCRLLLTHLSLLAQPLQTGPGP